MAEHAQTARRQQDRGGKTVRRVLDAAHDLMAEGGFDAVQLAAVSAKSGVSTGSLYHHFGSKNGIILRLVEEFTSRAVADLDDLDLSNHTFEDRLKALLDMTSLHFRNNPELYRSMSQRVRTDPSIWEPLRSLRTTFETRMMQELGQALLARGLRDPQAAIHRMLQAILGILTHSVLFNSGPVGPSYPNLEPQIYAIGHAVLLLTDEQEPQHDV